MSAVLLAVVSPLLPLVLAVAALALFMAGISPILDARALEVAGGDRNRYSLLRVWGSASFIGSVLLVGWLIDQTQITAMFAVLAAALLATGLVGLTFRGQTGGMTAVPHLTGIEGASCAARFSVRSCWPSSWSGARTWPSTLSSPSWSRSGRRVR